MSAALSASMPVADKLSDARDARDEFFRFELRERSAVAEQGEHVVDARVELRRRNAVMHESDAMRFGGIERFGGEEQTPRLTHADGGDDVRRNHRRHEAEFHFGKSELRRVRGDDDVAARDESDAAAVRRAVHARDGRLRQVVQRAHQFREALRIGAIVGFRQVRHAAHPVQVGAGGKRSAVAGEHDGADRGVFVELGQRVGEFVDQLVVERVVDVGTVQRRRARRGLSSGYINDIWA